VASSDQVRQLALDEVRANLRDFLTSVTRDVPPLIGETDGQYEVRRIGGYCNHPQTAGRTLQEMLVHTYLPMVDIMPVIRDIFLGRAVDPERQAGLEKNRLRVLREDESDGELKIVFTNNTSPTTSFRRSAYS
jgi:hypothetical protein